MPIGVELIDHMGSDLSVVNAARVSFAKASEYIYVTPGGMEVTPDEDFDYSRTKDCGYGRGISERDQKLIKYLATHNHWSPFAHAFASFRIKAPIFVARQLGKHQVGLAWNEVSRRYVDDEPEFFEPKVWRKRADDVKQGSSEDAVDKPGFSPSEAYDVAMAEALSTYYYLLDAGVCPEQARMVLPQSMLTSWIWSGSLMAFSRVCNLRLDSHTQVETREVAKMISDQLAPLFPHSWKALSCTSS